MPIDRGVIDQQLAALGEGLRWWSERELRDLPAVLREDERITAITRGKLGRPRFLRRSWLLVVTDARLICLRSAPRRGWRQLEVTGSQITRVALRVGPFRGRVVLTAGGHTYRLLVPRPDAYRLLQALTILGAPGRSAVSGFAPTRIARRVIDHVLALPAAAFGPDLAPASPPPLPPPPPPPARSEQEEQHVQQLEEEVRELRDQVEFLEQLLRQRQTALPGGGEPASS